MTLFDYAVLSIVSVSLLLSLFRGLVREVLSLAGWVAAFLVAGLFGAEAASWLPAQIANENGRLLIGIIGTFIVVLVAMSLLAMLAAKLMRSAGLGLEDRLLGAVFGFVRGVLIVLVIVLAAGLTSLPRTPAWRDAMLSAPLEALAGYVRAWLPAALSRRMRYD